MTTKKKQIVWVRKEIRLDEDTIKNLEKLAEEDKRVIKQFMEKILQEYSDKNPRK